MEATYLWRVLGRCIQSGLSQMRVALYIRVSTERQANEGDSLEEQESELKKYCDFRKFAIHQIYIERGRSGGNTNRPEYQKLVKAIRQKKINAVVVKKLDRLSRSLLDFEQLMNIMNENEVEFISIKENFDTTTAMGKAMLRVALVFAQLEREQTSERVSDVMTHRASLGLFNGGCRPFGYSIIEKELVPYPKEKQSVELVFQKFLETRSTSAVAHYLNDNGVPYREGKSWGIRQVHKMLQMSLYLGHIFWKGKTYNGIHQPLISTKTFEKVQAIFRSRNFTKATNSTPALFAKRIFCGVCGSPLAPNYAYNSCKVKYLYYRCTGSKNDNKKCASRRPYFNLEQLEKRVIDIILSLSEEQYFLLIENKALKHNEQIAARVAEKEKVLDRLEESLSDIKTRKEKYLDGLLTSRFSSKERDLITTKLSELESEEKQLKSQIFRQQTLIIQTKEEGLSITEIKKMFIRYRSEHPFESHQTERTELFMIIENITCAESQLEIQFNLLPWKEVFPLRQAQDKL